MRLGLFVQLLQAGQKTGLEADLGRAVMIGMPRFPIRQDHDARPQVANLNSQAHAHADGIFQTRIGKTQIAAPGQTHRAGGGVRFLQTNLGRSAAAHVAGRKIQHAGAIALLGHADQRAAAGLLHIIGVSGDGENIERLFDGRRSGVYFLPHA